MDVKLKVYFLCCSTSLCGARACRNITEETTRKDNNMENREILCIFMGCYIRYMSIGIYAFPYYIRRYIKCAQTLENLVYNSYKVETTLANLYYYRRDPGLHFAKSSS